MVSARRTGGIRKSAKNQKVGWKAPGTQFRSFPTATLAAERVDSAIDLSW